MISDPDGSPFPLNCLPDLVMSYGVGPGPALKSVYKS